MPPLVRADEYAEKPPIWPKFLLFAFVLWFVWAFLNDRQGRLYTWTDGKCSFASPPSKEVLEQRDAANKTKKTSSDGGTNSVPGTMLATNMPIAVVPAVPAK